MEYLKLLFSDLGGDFDDSDLSSAVWFTTFGILRSIVVGGNQNQLLTCTHCEDVQAMEDEDVIEIGIIDNQIRQKKIGKMLNYVHKYPKLRI